MRNFEDNRVVRHTGSEYPIFQAPIGTIARGRWASAISDGGGMGLLETHLLSVKELEHEADLVRQHTNRSFGYHLLPDAFSHMPEHEADMLAYVERVRAPFVTMGYSGVATPDAKDKWRYVKRLKDNGTICYYVVDTVEEALRAEDAGVDGLILGGGEAGGARNDHGLHIFALIQKVHSRTDLPLVASGGIADGIGMAGAFALGAEGILMGTRFMAAEESPLHINWKQAVAAAEEVNYLQFGMPDTRMLAVRNAYSDRVRSGEIDPKGNAYCGDGRATFYDGDLDVAIVAAGESAVLVDAVKPAAQIIEETIQVFWEQIERLAALGTSGARRAA